MRNKEPLSEEEFQAIPEKERKAFIEDYDS